MTETTITLCGKEVKMRYCAATEIGYEELTDKSSAIFVPEVIKDKNGKIKDVKQNANLNDYIKLSIAGIIAAYPDGEEPPVTAKQIVNEATGEEITSMVTAIVKLRGEWYRIPTPAVDNTPADESTDGDKDDEEEKN